MSLFGARTESIYNNFLLENGKIISLDHAKHILEETYKFVMIDKIKTVCNSNNNLRTISTFWAYAKEKPRDTKPKCVYRLYLMIE